MTPIANLFYAEDHLEMHFVHPTDAKFTALHLQVIKLFTLLQI